MRQKAAALEDSEIGQRLRVGSVEVSAGTTSSAPEMIDQRCIAQSHVN